MKLYQRTGEVVHDLQNMKIGCTSSSRHFSIKKKSSVSPAGHPNKGRRCRGVRGGGEAKARKLSGRRLFMKRSPKSDFSLPPDAPICRLERAELHRKRVTGTAALFSLVPANDVSVQLSVEFTAPLLFQLTRIISFRRKVHSFK